MRKTISRQVSQGKQGLQNSPRSGRKRGEKGEDIKYLEESSEKDKMNCYSQ